jgi:hypothetical protein
MEYIFRAHAILVELGRLKVGELNTGLLSSEGSNKIHQRGRQSIVGIKTVSLELGANGIHALRVISLLDDGRNEASELRLLPALLLRQLGVDEVQSVEGVGRLDAAVHMDAAVGAGVALDDGGGVDDLELGGVGLDGEVIAGDDTDDGEEGAGGLPAFRATAGVVVGDVALQGDDDLVGGAAALESSTGEVGVTLGEAVVDERVDGGHYVRDGVFQVWKMRTGEVESNCACRGIYINKGYLFN